MFVVILISSFAGAGELNDDCETAVDAADRLGSDVNKECDYSNVGLNGVLHRALANKEKASIDKKANDVKLNTEDNSEISNKKIAEASSAGVAQKDSATINSGIAKRPLPPVVSAEFGTSQQLATARYDLVRKIARECPAGFVMNEERYLPTENNLLKLELIYRCL